MTKVHVPIRAIARRIGVHENTVRNWIDRGILPALRLPTGARRVASEDVEKLEARILGLPTSFPEVQSQSPPKSVPESDQPRPESYPTL